MPDEPKPKDESQPSDEQPVRYVRDPGDKVDYGRHGGSSRPATGGPKQLPKGGSAENKKK